MGWSAIEIGGYACLTIAMVVLIASQVFFWRERRDQLARLEGLMNMLPRHEYKIQPDAKVPEGKAYAAGFPVALDVCPLCMLVDHDKVRLSGSFICKSCYFKQTGKLWGVDNGLRKPKVITEEREALIEQRLAKEAQARDPIFP